MLRATACSGDGRGVVGPWESFYGIHGLSGFLYIDEGRRNIVQCMPSRSKTVGNSQAGILFNHRPYTWLYTSYFYFQKP